MASRISSLSDTYTVIYRVGGKARFCWRRVSTVYASYQEAKASADELERQGYRAVVHNRGRLDAIGLPDNFEAGDPPAEVLSSGWLGY